MNALILMTRIPIAGKTKTRLMDILTGEECAELHRAFLLDLFNLFNHLKDDMDIYLTYTPEGSFHIIEDMVPSYIKFFPQRGEDLGKKMQNALEEILNKGYESTILIGSDIPNIQPDDIHGAFHLLEDKDICLGPTLDGGYYLVGMKEPQPFIFDNSVEWGKKSVFESTCDIASSKGLSIGLAVKHVDIDTKEDLLSFIKEIEEYDNKAMFIPQNTLEYIKNIERI